MSTSLDFKARNLVQRGTRAAQPLATAVAEGTLYYVTDEHLLERSTSAAWQSVGTSSYYAEVTNSAPLSLANATWTLITWDTETFDPSGLHSTVTNKGRINVPVTGKYFAVFQVAFNASGAGDRFVSIEKNGNGVESGAGATRLGVMQPGAPSATFQGFFPLIWFGSLTAGDYIEAFAYQSSGGALNFAHGALWEPYFALIYVGE